MEISIDIAQEWLIEYAIATEDEVALVTSINGYNLEALEAILFTRTGYRSFDQLDEFESDED